MTAQQLKNSILQMAVQGKLVPQDPNDEPASILLERIRAEKEEMIKEGKIKKERNPSIIFRGDDNLFYEKVGDQEPVCIADEVPFEIPESWEWVRLGSLTSVISDGTHKTPNYVERGIPFISVQNISSGKLDLTKIKYITEFEHEKLIERVHPQLGDILFCRIGTLGKAIEVTWDFPFSIFVSLGLLRMVLPQLSNYIIFIINSPLGGQWIQDNKVGGGTHTFKINLVDIPQMLIPVPPLNEQDRIVKKINDIIPNIEDYESKESLLSKLSDDFPDKLKKSILQIAVQGKLVPQDPNDEPASVLLEKIRAEKEQLIKAGKIKRDKHESVIYRRDGSYYEKVDGIERCIDDEVPFDIPASWEWVRVSQVIDVRDGTHDTPKYTEKGIPLITSKNLVDGKIDFNTAKLISYEDANTINIRSRVDDGDVLFAMIGSIGNPVLVKKEREFCIKNMALFKVISIDSLDMEYLFWFLYNEQYLIKKQASGGVQSFVSLTYLRNYLFPIPPINEQKRIVQKIINLLENCTLL